MTTRIGCAIFIGNGTLEFGSLLRIMELMANQAGAQRMPVTVIWNQTKKIKQPDHFRVCPLGMQMCSETCVPQFEIMDLHFDLSDLGGEQMAVTCCGVVVNCQPEHDGALYRVWVKFLDLPEQTRQRIRSIAKQSKLLCPYCENF